MDAADELKTQPFPAGATTTLTYDAANQLATGSVSTGASYTYNFDSAANRHTRVDGTGATLTYNYDQLNRLTSYVPAGPTPPTYGYTYNGDGLRMAKSTNGSATASFAWDVAEGLPILLNDVSTNYVTGPDGLPIEQVTSTSALYFYQADQLGSTRLISDASKATVNTYNYDSYGNPTASSGALANPFQYAGQYSDSESGFYYLRARYYDPSSGQFAARDQLTATTRQPYVYVQDSPLNGADPAGLWCAGVQAGAISFGGVRGASQDWAAGVCDNGDLYASSTSGELKPKPGNGTRGTFGDAGFGVHASGNASCARQLGGGFHQDLAGAGAGPVAATLSAANGSGVDVQSASVFPMPGAGAGAGLSSFDTNTNLVSWNWVQHVVNDPLVGAAHGAHNLLQWATRGR